MPLTKFVISVIRSWPTFKPAIIFSTRFPCHSNALTHLLDWYCQFLLILQLSPRIRKHGDKVSRALPRLNGSLILNHLNKASKAGLTFFSDAVSSYDQVVDSPISRRNR